MDAVLPLLPMRLDTIGEELLESFTGYIPRFFIKDGRLGYFDASYNEDKAKKLRIGDGLGTWVKDFLRQHPEEEKAILISLESFEAERRASEEKAAELERLKVESESAQEEINVAKVKIAENEREIEKLERKVLGKGKAREQINDLKACSLELDRDIEEQTKRIREYQKKERESHSDRIKGRDEFYAELIAKYNGFIPWTWVIEENAQDSSTPKIDDIADAGTPELKNMKNVDNIGVDPDVLRKWKSLLDDGLISKEEYAMKKKQILGL